MIYKYKDYKRYLVDEIKKYPKGGRGIRAALAKQMACQTAFVSQVLGGDSHFSLEQGHQLNEYFHHPAEASKYFLLMIQFARAGTRSLRDFIEAQLNELRDRNLRISSEIKEGDHLTEVDEQIYSSAWYYSAIHVAISISQLQTPQALSQHFGLDQKLVIDVLGFLLGCGLAKRDGGRFAIGEARVHLGGDSPMRSKHHANWRLQAIQDMEKFGSRRHLHYSSVVTISREDLARVRDEFISSVKRVNEIVADSPEEVVGAIVLDCFEVRSRDSQLN